jgi:hypothetical protein
LLFIYDYILSQIFRDIDMDYHHIISNERNMPLPDEYMNVLRKHDRDSYDSRRRHEQMRHPSAYT